MPVFQSYYEKTKTYDRPLYAEPKTTEENFSVKSIDKTGIFVLNDNRYSKSFVLSDINFAGMTDAEQKTIIIQLSHVFDSIPCRFSYVIANEYSNETVFNYELKGDERDYIREAFNEVIEERITTAKKGLYQSLYFTVTIESKSLEEARTVFASRESALRSQFIQLGINGTVGSQLESMDINTRMQKWYNLTHLGLRSKFQFNYLNLLSMKKDWLSYVSPEEIEFYSDYFVLNGKIYGRSMYVSKYPQNLTSEFLAEISKINCTSYVAVNNEPITMDAYNDEITRKHAKVGRQIENQKKRNRKNNDFLSDASESLLDEQTALNEVARNVDKGDEHYFNSSILILFLANSMEEMEKITDKIESDADGYSYEVKKCFDMQRQAFNSNFIFGIQEFKRVCNFSSKCLAMFMPFKTQEINMPNGKWYGMNQLSQNEIRGNRKLVAPPHAIFMGMSRSGKTSYAKAEQSSIVVEEPDDQIMIIDPQNEYRDMVDVPGIDGSVVSFDMQKKEYVNPLDVNFEGVDYIELQDIIDEKIDFIITLLSSCIKKEIDAKTQGIIDRVVTKVYSENYAMRKRLNGETSNVDLNLLPNYMKVKNAEEITPTNLSYEEQEKMYSPLFQDIYQALVDMNTDEANDLAGYMEIFVNGSLNLFNHRTTISLNKKFIVFNMSNIKDNLRNTCMLVMMEIVRNKIKQNYLAGGWTHVYIDEFHELLGIQKVVDFIFKLWKEAAKMNCALTAITQNMTDLYNKTVDANKLAAILSNTEYFALLKQSSIDKKLLIEFLPSISPAMFNYVEGARKGTGLLKMGDVTVPFDMHMREDAKLLKIIAQNPESKEASI